MLLFSNFEEKIKKIQLKYLTGSTNIILIDNFSLKLLIRNEY